MIIEMNRESKITYLRQSDYLIPLICQQILTAYEKAYPKEEISVWVQCHYGAHIYGNGEVGYTQQCDLRIMIYRIDESEDDTIFLDEVKLENLVDFAAWLEGGSK